MAPTLRDVLTCQHVCVAEVKTINLSLPLVWFVETGKLKTFFLFDSYC